jgi:hypothetical protein
MKNNMKLILIFLATIFIISQLSRCAIDRTPCDLDTEYIKVNNTHINPYQFYFEGTYISTIPANDIFVYYIEVGRHTKWYHLKLIQDSGFDSVPKIYEDTVAMDPCVSAYWSP